MYRDYLLLKIERNIMKFSIEQFCRLVRSLADKQYVEDTTFWNEYVFRYIHETSANKIAKGTSEKRIYKTEDAHKVWDALIYLKLKCPTLDVKDHISYVEGFMKQETPAAETAWYIFKFDT